MGLGRRALAAAMLAGVAGCSHAPVNMAGCNLPIQTLTLPTPPVASASVAPPTSNLAPPFAPPVSDYGASLVAALAPRAADQGPTLVAPARPAMLMLSGGGEHGAFGAGYLDAWKAGARASGTDLPEFRVVTGISTGALIAAFVFTGATEKAVAGYTINSESDLLDVTSRQLIGQVRAGAVGNLDPLRRRIDDLLDNRPGDDQLLADIATAAAAPRQGLFYVGVVNVRTGEAGAIDMTALASRWASQPPGATRDQTKRCFIEALVASASAPLAAPPVYIDGEEYIDGGARFGMFRAAADQALATATRRSADSGAPAPISFMILNGQTEIAPQCRYDEVTGPDGVKTCPASGKLRDWDVVSLGLRSVDILTNQVYRFSVDYAAQGPGEVHFTRILPDVDGYVATLDGQSKTCADWHAVDQAANPPPVQFNPHEMACLIAYGRSRSAAEQWWNFR
jgi:predicted patatin/cPLA2 family phospholipase